MMEAKGPYTFIELSTDSETEIGAANAQVKAPPRVQKEVTLITIDRRLRELSLAGNFAAVVVELERMHAEVRRERGPPALIFLRRLKLLQSAAETAADRNADGLKLLRAKLRRLFNEFEEELEGVEGDEVLQSQEIPQEEPEEGLATRSKPGQAVREEEEIDFAKRLKLSRDDRRKFWQVKTRLPARKEEERRRAAPRRTGKEKNLKEEIDRFMHIAIDDQSVEKRLTEIRALRHQLRAEERTRILDELEFIGDKTVGMARCGSFSLLVLLKLDEVGETHFITASLISNCLEYLFDAFSTAERISIETSNISEIARCILRLSEEMQFSLRLVEPYSQELRSLLFLQPQIVKLIRLQLLAIGDQRLYSELAIAELRHIFGWPTELLSKLPSYAEMFEGESVEQRAGELYKATMKSSDGRQAAEARLLYASCLALNNEKEDVVVRLLSATDAAFKSDSTIAILHNHVVALVGLRLVQKGKLLAAKAALDDLLKARDLAETLGQVDYDRSGPWDFPEIGSLVPPHLHISLDRLRHCFLLTCVASETHLLLSATSTHSLFSRFFSERGECSTFIRSNSVEDRLYRAAIFLSECRVAEALEEVRGIDDISEESLNKAFVREGLECFCARLKNIESGALLIDACSQMLTCTPEQLILAIQNANIKRVHIQENIIFVDAACKKQFDPCSATQKLQIFEQTVARMTGIPS